MQAPKQKRVVLDTHFDANIKGLWLVDYKLGACSVLCLFF